MLRLSKTLDFTLLELMVTIAILAIVAGIAAPSFVTLIENNRVQTQANTFFTSLIAARSEAVKRNQPVVLYESAQGTDCGAGDHWKQRRLDHPSNLTGQASSSPVHAHPLAKGLIVWT